MSVLIIEDDEATADALRSLLSGEGIDATCATSLPAALAAASSEPPPDAVLLDLVLPPWAGVDASLAAIPRLASRSVVVVVSARSDQKTIEAALAAGATRYWVKGDWRSPERMKRALIRCIEQRRLLAKLEGLRRLIADEDVPEPYSP